MSYREKVCRIISVGGSWFSVFIYAGGSRSTKCTKMLKVWLCDA